MYDPEFQPGIESFFWCPECEAGSRQMEVLGRRLVQ